MKDGPHPTLAGKGILGTTTACEASPTLELVSFTPQANPLTRGVPHSPLNFIASSCSPSTSRPENLGGIPGSSAAALELGTGTKGDAGVNSEPVKHLSAAPPYNLAATQPHGVHLSHTRPADAPSIPAYESTTTSQAKNQISPIEPATAPSLYNHAPFCHSSKNTSRPHHPLPHTNIQSKSIHQPALRAAASYEGNRRGSGGSGDGDSRSLSLHSKPGGSVGGGRDSGRSINTARTGAGDTTSGRRSFRGRAARARGRRDFIRRPSAG